jgi:hypothetical protein
MPFAIEGLLWNDFDETDSRAIGPVLPLSAPHQIVSVYAGAENRAVIHHRALEKLCQR